MMMMLMNSWNHTPGPPPAAPRGADPHAADPPGGSSAAAADPAVLADVHAECARYGAVERVALAAGDVVVDFALVDDAVACLAALKFKRFCGAQLSVEFLEGNRE